MQLPAQIRPLFILTEYGKTFSQKGFSQWFNQKARDAGFVNCTAHGVRKGAAAIAANDGAAVSELMALFGWMTKGMAFLYTKDANRRRLADAASQHLKLRRHKPSRANGMWLELSRFSHRIVPPGKRLS